MTTCLLHFYSACGYLDNIQIATDYISSQWSVEHYLSMDVRHWQESKGMWRVHFGREVPWSIYFIGITCMVDRILVNCSEAKSIVYFWQPLPVASKNQNLYSPILVTGSLVCICLLKWGFTTLIPLLLSYYCAVDHHLLFIVLLSQCWIG